MAGREGGTQIEPGIIARAAAGIRYALTGKSNDFFGPMKPLAPVAQEAEGRQFDYPFGYNLQQQPRAGEPISFPQLRALADGYDLMRLAIETRKDQMAKLTFEIKRKDGKDVGKEGDAIKELFKKPDREHRWKEWLRMLLEDLLVIDAPVVYPRLTKGGQLYALEPVDGATIKRVLNIDGRTPEPPDPAYQQVLKGLPAVDYTREELIYAPRNVRTNRVYGYSPVEQVILLINIALRREVHQLNYYTEGNIPAMLASVPAAWNADQIQKFQNNFDLLMSGDLAKRRRITFIPDGVKQMPIITEKLFDETDEWLARVICYAFSLPPTAFVKQANRATAGTAQEVALEEGLAPIMAWVKDLMDDIIEDYFALPDLEFYWSDMKDVDPLVQAQIDQIYVNAGVDTPDEVREARGKAALADGAGKTIKQPVPLLGAGDPTSNGQSNGKPGAKPTSGKGNPDGVTAAAAEKVATIAAGRLQRLDTKTRHPY